MSVTWSLESKPLSRRSNTLILILRSHRLSEFPVSSGNSHRQKEPSPSEEPENQIPTGMIAAQKAISHLVATGDPIVKLLQLEDKSNSSKVTPFECHSGES